MLAVDELFKTNSNNKLTINGQVSKKKSRILIRIIMLKAKYKGANRWAKMNNLCSGPSICPA
jgi:hypothetical protein